VLEEFKKFALRGSVVDLAIGVIIGAAFNKIVSSAVDDVFMPVIGFITGGLDFSNYFFQLAGSPAATYVDAKKAGATIGYGEFITVAINFLIVALVLFFVVRGINRLRAKQEAEPEAPPKSEQLLEEIRDLLARPRV
jgi:large conductance mechanosensitive channel